MTLTTEESKMLDTFRVHLERAAARLEVSLDRTKGIDTKTVDENEIDALESLISRFARTSDILLRKVWRLLMKLVEDETGTIIDIVNFAEKMGFVEAAAMNQIRQTRNRVTHDYVMDEISEVTEAIRKQSPVLLDAIRATLAYRIP